MLKNLKCKRCETVMCETNGNFVRLPVEVRGKIFQAEIHIAQFELDCPNPRCSAKRLWVAKDVDLRPGIKP